jgi:hypothetical protein
VRSKSAAILWKISGTNLVQIPVGALAGDPLLEGKEDGLVHFSYII